MFILAPFMKKKTNNNNNKEIVLQSNDKTTAYKNQIIQQIASIPIKKIQHFIPIVTNGVVISVHDGDTITLATYVNEKLYKFSVRLRGIDCAEIRTTNPIEKECAELAKKETSELVLGKYVDLTNVNIDKYGRLLADVVVNGTNVSHHLLQRRLAVEYFGKTKVVPKNWMSYYNHGLLL